VNDLRGRVERELLGNILPFWMERTVDHRNGGFYGCVDSDLTVRNDVERSAVVNARILWTFSAAYRVYGDAHYSAIARRACDYLRAAFADPVYRGVYWSVDAAGRPVNDRKHVYAQAFAIYGLAEYALATGSSAAAEWARELFALVEAHTRDEELGGNIECRARDWSPLADMRLSEKEPPAVKTMNTLLHLMEAYTNLRRLGDDPLLASRHEALVELFLDRVLDPVESRFRLFFDAGWRPLPDHISPGHDIEGSWLLVEAAEVAGRPDLLARAQAAAERMADVVLRTGLDAEGFVIYQAGAHHDPARHWWPQAEGVVGFYNAYQLTGRKDFERAALRLWDGIEQRFVDRERGEWHKIVGPDGAPDLSQPKAGPWECPYHNARACLEMLARLPQE
jgi:mannobiose 2-epimerase